MEQIPFSLFADPNFCGDCRKPMADDEYLIEINTPGGYGRKQVLICTECAKKEIWKSRIKEIYGDEGIQD